MIRSSTLSSENQPVVRCFASSLLGQVPLNDQWSDDLLPLDGPESFRPRTGQWTYGLYFQAISDILAKDSYGFLLEATQKQLGCPLKLLDIMEILIYAEKHGNLYHPAKIEVNTLQGKARFVLNVALTERGRAVLTREISVLMDLNKRVPYPWLPFIFFRADGEQGPSTLTDPKPVSLFLADWFEGYHEFHLSLDPADKTQKVVLWDGSPRPFYLSDRQARKVYKQISMILTLYYNPLTQEQIFPWHQAAGDFVVNVEGEKVEARLITVRQYGAMTDPDQMPIEEALLFFWLNLSLRIRLDRFDGVGDWAWAGEYCLEGAWEGFLKGLRIKEQEGSLTSGFVDIFLKKIKLLSQEALEERFFALLESYDPGAPDLSVLRQKLSDHIRGVAAAFQNRFYYQDR